MKSVNPAHTSKTNHGKSNGATTGEKTADGDCIMVSALKREHAVTPTDPANPGTCNEGSSKDRLPLASGYNCAADRKSQGDSGTTPYSTE
jgi:hypothetical protein